MDEGDGWKTIKLSSIEKSVLLPLSLTESMEGNPLRIARNGASVELSSSFLHELEEALEPVGDAGVIVQWFAEQSSHDFSRLVDQGIDNETLSLTAASDLYRFAVEHPSKEGIALKEPATLSFKVDANTNSELLGVYRIGEDGTLHYAGGTFKDGYMTVEVREPGTYGILEYNKTFADVAETMWAINVIKQMAAKHIVQGKSGAHFDPYGEVTRAEFAAMLVRALGLRAEGESDFGDVDRNKWYAEAISAASGAGIVTGRSGGAFAPDETVTREEMVVMLVRAYEYAGGYFQSHNHGNDSGSQFPAEFGDALQISDWAMEAVSLALEAGLIKGRDGAGFQPLETLTRAEAAQALATLLKLLFE